MYPFETDDEEEIVDDELDSEDDLEETEEPPTEYGIDFSTGKLTGGKVTGAKAVAVWAWNALKCPRYRYETTDWQYGSELEDLIGQGMSQDEALMMVDSIIRDALLPNENILDIEDLECTLDGDSLAVSFTLVTEFGEEDMNVTI